MKVDDKPLIDLTRFINSDEVGRWSSSPWWKPSLKDTHKQTKDNNAKAGSSTQFSFYYKDFDEMLGEQGIISLKNIKEVGCINPMNLHTTAKVEILDFISCLTKAKIN